MSFTTASASSSSPPSLTWRMLHPPVNEVPFWIVQVSLIAIVGVHFLADVRPSLMSGSFPTGVPVALLVIPIGYSALRYGLAGSVATTTWTVVLWLPDLLLPHDEGHVLDDVMNLSIVVMVAVIFGLRVEAEHRAQARALAVETGYRQLFESNRSPIRVLDHDDRALDANPAALELFGPTVIGRTSRSIFSGSTDVIELSGKVLTFDNGHDYRLDATTLPLGPYAQHVQLGFEDVTEERSEERRSREFARQMVQVDEDQRRRLARELHDEPLQLFLHLARHLEALGSVDGVPHEVTSGLALARRQALEAASRLRTLARDLRPPALDQLGLVAALSSLVAHIGESGEPSAQLEVRGEAIRLAPDVELGAFRIVQESLNNALRHSGARHLRTTVGFSSDHLHLEIVDDGRGFDSDDQAQHVGTSLGIVGMRERARLLGGSLSVHSGNGLGTVIDATIPMVVPSALLTVH